VSDWSLEAVDRGLKKVLDDLRDHDGRPLDDEVIVQIQSHPQWAVYRLELAQALDEHLINPLMHKTIEDMKAMLGLSKGGR
jgi:hypothetical protein